VRHSLITSGRQCDRQRTSALATLGLLRVGLLPATVAVFLTTGLAQKSTGLLDDLLPPVSFGVPIIIGKITVTPFGAEARDSAGGSSPSAVSALAGGAHGRPETES
jgi:hypothetical protein